MPKLISKKQLPFYERLFNKPLVHVATLPDYRYGKYFINFMLSNVKFPTRSIKFSTQKEAEEELSRCRRSDFMIKTHRNLYLYYEFDDDDGAVVYY